MPRRFCALSLLRATLSGRRIRAQLRRARPRHEYDVIIVGGGGLGLGTAYYLAKEHGIGRIAVLEKGRIGGGNTIRNTTILRSNHLSGAGAALYEHSVQLWECLSGRLPDRVRLAPRGVLMLAHTPQEVRVLQRHVHANRLAGIDTEWLTPQEARRFCPPLQIQGPRHPVLGAALQRNGGTARDESVAWGFAQAASQLGVDVLEGCEVTGMRLDNHGAVSAVETSRGLIRAPRIGVVAGGHSSMVMKMAGLALPLQTHPLQALVSEPVKPFLPCVLMSGSGHAHVSQSDGGELVIGAGADSYVSYTRRGGLHVPCESLESVCELLPPVRRLRMMRCWGGTVDVTPDRSPIIGLTPVPGLYINCGWGTGGFRATPGSAQVFAWTIAHDEPHPLAAPFSLARFRDGLLIDEAAAAAAH